MVQEVNIHKSAFTVDVEDGISIASRDAFGIEVPQTHRVVTYTKEILELLEKHEVKGTFFILGKVARDFPDLIKEINRKGHEIGVHGYNHWQFFKMTKDQAYHELKDAKKLLEDLTGETIIGHRAPAFSIMPSTAWALDVIASCGFEYDSSIMPLKGLRYGWEEFPKEMTEIQTAVGHKLIEVPLSSINVLGKEMPFSGGGYLRLFPFNFTKWAFIKTIKERPVILYLHPHELDYTKYPDYYFEQLKKVSWKKQLRLRSNWINRKFTKGKLDKLLSRFNFTTMETLIKSQQADGNLKTYHLEDQSDEKVTS